MEEKEIVRKGYNKTAEKLQEIFGVKKEGSDKLKLLDDFISRIPQIMSFSRRWLWEWCLFSLFK